MTEVAKKRININITTAMYKAHKLETRNISAYINGLLEEAYMRHYSSALVKKVTEQVRDELLGDEVFIEEVKSRVANTSTQWGA